MRHDEADAFARMIHASWPAGHHVSLDVWAEELAELDADTVKRAVTQMRRTLTRPPTIAELHATYRSLAVAATPPPRPDDSDEAISLDEYLRRLARRATDGDTDAADELERWQSWRGHPAVTPAEITRTEAAA